MNYFKTKSPNFFLLSLAFTTVLLSTLPHAAKAGDVGVGRRTGGIAEIDLVSALNGSTVVRSLPTQEGAPQGFGDVGDDMQILDVTTGLQLGSGKTTDDGHAHDLGGQYEIVLPKPLTTGQRIQAFNVDRKFYSSTVTVSDASAPAIDEPVLKGAKLIKGRGTPGSSIQIRNVVTGVVLGTGTVVAAPGATNGTFSVSVTPPPSLFHSIQASDVTKKLTGRSVPILNLLTDHSPLKQLCATNQVGVGGFMRKTFACALPHPRGVMIDAAGNPLIIAGTAPLDPGYALLPAGIFQLAPASGKLSLFAPVNGVALKPGPGGTFGAGVFVARPRLFNVRKTVLVQPGDGEIFRVTPTPLQLRVFNRSLDFAPTGLAFGAPGSPFPGELLTSSFLGAGLRRIKSTGAASPFTTLPGLQGLAFGPGGASAFGADLYAAQPSSGRILRISGSGAATPFAIGLTSPTDLAFGIGGAFGTDLYVADAGSGQILQIDSTGKPMTFASGLGAPFGLAFSTTPPALFVTDYLTGNIIQFTP
jgi:hypothetical protein